MSQPKAPTLVGRVSWVAFVYEHCRVVLRPCHANTANPVVVQLDRRYVHAETSQDAFNVHIALARHVQDCVNLFRDFVPLLPREPFEPFACHGGQEIAQLSGISSLIELLDQKRRQLTRVIDVDGWGDRTEQQDGV